MRLIVEIGKPAVPALENALKRGDETLKAHAARCLQDIDSARASSKGGADTRAEVGRGGEMPDKTVNDHDQAALPGKGIYK